jgi:hypothetical protein
LPKMEKAMLVLVYRIGISMRESEVIDYGNFGAGSFAGVPGDELSA